MKRPMAIYSLLEKVSSGTFLSPAEFAELEAHISELEKENERLQQQVQTAVENMEAALYAMWRAEPADGTRLRWAADDLEKQIAALKGTK